MISCFSERENRALADFLFDFLTLVDVRRFDSDLIPLEGPTGLLGRVERLLDKSPTRSLGTREKHELLDDLVRIVRENEW